MRLSSILGFKPCYHLFSDTVHASHIKEKLRNKKQVTIILGFTANWLIFCASRQHRTITCIVCFLNFPYTWLIQKKKKKKKLFFKYKIMLSVASKSPYHIILIPKNFKLCANNISNTQHVTVRFWLFFPPHTGRDNESCMMTQNRKLSRMHSRLESPVFPVRWQCIKTERYCSFGWTNSKTTPLNQVIEHACSSWYIF